MNSQPEQALVRALAAGDERAFNEVVGRHHRSLVRLARNFVRSEASAEEVVQDTWSAVIAGIGRFEGRSSLKTWLFSICVNKARTQAERERRTTPFSAVATEGEDGTPAPVEDRFAADGPGPRRRARGTTRPGAWSRWSCAASCGQRSPSCRSASDSWSRCATSRNSAARRRASCSA